MQVNLHGKVAVGLEGGQEAPIPGDAGTRNRGHDIELKTFPSPALMPSYITLDDTEYS